MTSISERDDLKRRLTVMLSERAEAVEVLSDPDAVIAHQSKPGGRQSGRRWMLIAAAAIVILALGLIAVVAVREPDSVQTDTVPPTPSPTTIPATTSPLLPEDSSPVTLPALTPVSEPDTTPETAPTEVSTNTSPSTELESSAIVESTLDWTSPFVFSDTAPNRYDGYFAAGDGPLVASTYRDAPDVSGVAVSDDGVTWREVETLPGLAVQDADASGGTIAL